MTNLAILSLFFFTFAHARVPECDSDGQFPDEENCMNYYKCANGVATLEECPFGLFFDQVNDRGDICSM